MAAGKKRASGQPAVASRGEASPSSPPTAVSPAALAKLSGYTKQQVHKWCAMGMPCTRIPRGKRTDIVIDRDAGLRWIKGNATGIAGAHGGKRAGSGKKKAQRHAGTQAHRGNAAPPAPPPPPAPPARDPATPRRLTPPRTLEAESFGLRPPENRDQGAEDGRPDPSAPLTREQLRQLTPIEVKQHLDIEKILSERIARGEKEGTLIAVDAARKEWSEACTAAARVLAKLRDTLAARLITDLGLSSDKGPRLRQVIEQEAAHVLRAMRTASFGPDDEEDA